MLYPKRSVSAFTCAACPHEQVGLPVPIHRRRMDGHGILAKNSLSIGNAQQRGKRLSHLIVRPLQPSFQKRELRIGCHPMLAATIDYLHDISLGCSIQAQMPHVVIRFLQQLPDFRSRHLVRYGYGEVKQPFFISCMLQYPERAKRRQQSFCIHTHRQGDRKKETGYTIVVSYHLHCPFTNWMKSQAASFGA